MLTIGAVTGVHGIKGKLKVKSFATSLAPFVQGKTVLLEKEGSRKEFFTAGVSEVRKGILLALDGIHTPEAAQELVGHTILIHKDQLPPLEEDTWYWQDLYGLDVVDAQRGFLGKITSILATGASDVLVVQDNDSGQETMIPMHKNFVLSVDMDEGRVHTDLPEGL